MINISANEVLGHDEYAAQENTPACPGVVYPKAKLERIAQIIKSHEKEPSVVYDSVKDMFDDMGIDLST